MALQPIISPLGGGLSSVTGPSVGSDAPVGANLGVSDIDMGYGQTPINPDLSKLDMTGMSYANEQPIGGFAAPAYFPNNQLISGNTMQLPTNVATNPLSTYGTQIGRAHV